MGLALLIDFGSTNTKLRAIDLDTEEVVGSTQATSTVGTDITIGFEVAFAELKQQLDVKHPHFEHKLACSSAAGGLRMVAIGLVPELTAEAARQAALGAGANVTRVFSHELSKRELDELQQIAPDMILLAGGTDGGNKEVILHNARQLASIPTRCPIVVAGNKAASDAVGEILQQIGNSVRLVDNVLPEVNVLNVEPAREAIREVFVKHIIRAKGLERATDLVDEVIMPTPMATLGAANLLATGAGDEPGLGDLVVIEVGGATTNVHSIGSGAPSRPDLVPQGLPEPYAKRTVEGDLGIRFNAHRILMIAGQQRMRDNIPFPCFNLDLEMAVRALSEQVSRIPASEEEYALDVGLARTAADMAMERHAGVVEPFYTPDGTVTILRGKDLTAFKTVIGTGGIFSYGKEPRMILEAGQFRADRPFSLRSRSPAFFADEAYIMYAIGLLNTIAPDKALRILKKSLRPV
ncbi:MAG: glutamate mutase L [Betaproteobacteria bacterium]|nr:glutamate mutase L [Betaproteobacteria bacterium]